jgi:hypothetical protein
MAAPRRSAAQAYAAEARERFDVGRAAEQVQQVFEGVLARVSGG